MALDTESPDRDPSDESDNRMFTDSFAPRDDDPRAADPTIQAEEDELDDLEDLLPKGEPTEGTAPLP